MKNQKRNNKTINTVLLFLIATILFTATVSCSGFPISQTGSNAEDNQNREAETPTNTSTNGNELDQKTQEVAIEEQDPTQQLIPSNGFDSDVNLSQLFEAFWTSRELLHDNFLEQPVDDQVLANGALNGLADYLEQNNINLSTIELPEEAPSPESLAEQAKTPKEVSETFLPFWEAWNKLPYSQLPEDASPISLMRQALNGMVAALDDPYTHYFDPDLSEQWNVDLSGEYEGIGAWVDVDAEFLTIISPIKGTPAEDAGLLPGDQIIAIDGDDMTGVDPYVALKRVLGDAGTKVILTILRENAEEPFEVEIIRRKITIPYIETEMLDGGIAYLKLIRFYDGGDVDIRNALQSLLDENPQGLIFDLRGNPGGYLHIVVNIASEFISDGTILIEEFTDGSQKTYPVRNSKGIATEIPLVVLVDQGSASASEIFAGAIKDFGRGVLVGQTTFGKGVVQMPITLPDDQGMVVITIARWLTPNGDTIHEIGIDPDYLVEFTEADFDQNLDPQLQKAIELLTTGQ